MSLPQFTAESSLCRSAKHYSSVLIPQTSRAIVRPQTETGDGGGGVGQPWCPLMNWICGLCVIICDFIPFEGCMRICDEPCLYCRK
jgi:hypothetical protein